MRRCRLAGVKIGKMLGCALLGLIAAAAGVIVSPGLLGRVWLGVILGLALIALGSALTREIAGIAGGLLYVLVVFAASTAWLNFPISADMLALPDSEVAAVWPLLSAVTALLPLWFRDNT